MPDSVDASASSAPTISSHERVESWKGIAVYLGRDVRTVQRWEKQEGLPVHRHVHNKLSTVYAFKSELDTWWHERGIKIDNDRTSGEVGGDQRTGFLTVERIFLLAIVTIALGAWFVWPRSIPQLPLRRFSFAPKEPVVMARISPDGKHIAYTTQQKAESALWIQDLDRVEPRKISGTQGAEFPFWSPDSTMVGYGTRTELRSVPVVRGDPATICQLPVKGEPFTGGAWTRTGQSIVFTQVSRQFFEVPSRGGTSKVLGEIAASSKIEHVEHPQQLPGSLNQLLFMFKSVGQPHSFGLFPGGSADYDNLLPTGLHGICPVYSETGHILFDTRSDDWDYAFIGALPFSATSGRVTGDVFPIATNGNFPSTSRDGTLVYVENTALWPPRQLVWRDRGGGKVGELGPIPYGTMDFALSGDQRKLAMNRLPTPQLVVRDLVSGSEISPISNSRLFGALWTPDGTSLTFAGVRGSNYDLVVQPATANGEETVLWATDADEFPGDWSADGRFLIYSVDSPKTPWDIWYLKKKDDAKGYESFPFIRSSHKERNPRFSPDGRFVAYTSDELDRPEVFVTGFPDNVGRVKVSTNGGHSPFWSRDGREVYYLEGQTLMAVMTEITQGIQFGLPVRLFDDPLLNNRAVAVSLDRQRFLVKETTGDARPPVIRVVQNWYSEFAESR